MSSRWFGVSLLKPHLLDPIEAWLVQENIFDRERKTTTTRARGILLYHAGLSCRATSHVLTQLVEPVNHNPISDWCPRTGTLFRKLPVKRHHSLAVNETSVRIEREDGDLEEHFLWVAANPRTSEVVHVALTQGRGGVEAIGFIRGVLKRCENTPFFHVDRGVWHPVAFQILSIDDLITRGSLRKTVETWNGVLKHRIRAFRERFPHNASRETVEAWCKGFAFVWNVVPWSTC